MRSHQMLYNTSILSYLLHTHHTIFSIDFQNDIQYWSHVTSLVNEKAKNSVAISILRWLLLDAQKWWTKGHHTHGPHTLTAPGDTRDDAEIQTTPIPLGFAVWHLFWPEQGCVWCSDTWIHNPWEPGSTNTHSQPCQVWPRVKGLLVVNFSSFPTWKFAKLLSLVRSVYPCICVHFMYKKVSSIHRVLMFSHSVVSDSLWIKGL